MPEISVVSSPCVISVPSHFPGSKGCAIVENRTAAEARRAIRSMTDTELRGRRGAFRRGFPELLSCWGWGLAWDEDYWVGGFLEKRLENLKG